MGVQIDGNGRRAVRCAVELAAPPESAWRAISTSAGISSWFVPTSIELGPTGQPAQVVSSFGPGQESVARFEGWDPPRTFVTVSGDLGVDAPPVTTTWTVEASSADRSRVLVHHSIDAHSADWDGVLEAWEAGWPEFFVLLALHVERFGGQSAAVAEVVRTVPGRPDEVWERFAQGLGLAARPAVGDALAPRDLPAVAGQIVSANEPREIVTSLTLPSAGYAHFFAMGSGSDTLLSTRLYLYGEGASDEARAAEERWRPWLDSID